MKIIRLWRIINLETEHKKRGRKKLPEGISERRLTLKDEDLQRLELILNIMYSNKEFKNMTEVDKASSFFRDAIMEKFTQLANDGTLARHLTELVEH